MKGEKGEVMMLTEDKVKGLWNQKKWDNEESFHLYFHFPFCNGKCLYCIYNPVDIKNCNKGEYLSYFEALLKQIKSFKDIINKRIPDSVYFGGGTPSLMPVNMLNQIANEVPNWGDIRVKVFEANPVSINKKKIDALSELGFTYLALGVQTLDKNLLKEYNREPPKEEHLKEITNYAISKKLHVNYDLMAFLKDDLDGDLDRLYKDLNRVMTEFKPPSLDIYPMYQKLEGSKEENIRKIIQLRRNILKSLYFNKDYDVVGGKQSLNISNSRKVESDLRCNYYLTQLSNEEFWNQKVYSCSGPDIAPTHQNVLSFGGYEDAWTYSYGANRKFVYYTKLNEKGRAMFSTERGNV